MQEQKWNAEGCWGRYVKRRLISLVSKASQLFPSPTHLNQQPYRAAHTVFTPVTSLLEVTACLCESQGESTKSDGIIAYSICIDMTSVSKDHLRGEILIILQNQYINVWLAIGIYSHWRKWNQNIMRRNLIKATWVRRVVSSHNS